VAASKKHDDADALIIAWERYDAISLKLALQGKPDPVTDEKAWVLFTEGKLDKLNSLSSKREDHLSGRVEFVQPADALDGWKPKVFKKDADNAVSVLAQQVQKIAKTKGTMLNARALQGGN
jgi:hypothetical protein